MKTHERQPVHHPVAGRVVLVGEEVWPVAVGGGGRGEQDRGAVVPLTINCLPLNYLFMNFKLFSNIWRRDPVKGECPGRQH